MEDPEYQSDLTLEKLEIVVEKLKNRLCHLILQIYDVKKEYDPNEVPATEDDIQIDSLQEVSVPQAGDNTDNNLELFKDSSMNNVDSPIITNITEQDKKLISVRKPTQNEIIKEEAKKELDSGNFI